MIDPARLSAWFAAHAPPLTLYARQLVDSPDLADDVVHEAFVALLSQQNEPDDVRAWLFATVRRRAISQWRSILRRRRREASFVRSAYFEQRMDDLIDARNAEEALRELPPEQREVVVLRIWGQMNFKQIAELTGAALSTVFDRYRTALRNVRLMLEHSQCENNPTTKRKT